MAHGRWTARTRSHERPHWPRVASLPNARGLPRPPRPRAASRCLRRRPRRRPDPRPWPSPSRWTGRAIGNRFCILPMEGWDGTAEGRADRPHRPPLAQLRAQRGQADLGRRGRGRAAGRRANPNQLLIGEGTLSALGAAAAGARSHEHRDRFGAAGRRDLYVGLQLTHSGRNARPHAKDRPEPLDGLCPSRSWTAGSRAGPAFSRTRSSTAWSRTSSRRPGAPAGLGYAVRRREALPRLPGPRAPLRARAARGATAARSRTGRASSARSWRGSGPRRPGWGWACASPPSTCVPYRPGANGIGVPETATAGYASAFGLLEDEAMDEALDDSRALLAAAPGAWACASSA